MAVRKSEFPVDPNINQTLQWRSVNLSFQSIRILTKHYNGGPLRSCPTLTLYCLRYIN